MLLAWLPWLPLFCVVLSDKIIGLFVTVSIFYRHTTHTHTAVVVALVGLLAALLCQRASLTSRCVCVCVCCADVRSFSANYRRGEREGRGLHADCELSENVRMFVR